MGHAELPPRIVRFGAFEADLTNVELRKHGAALRLQEQPFRVLEALVGRPGEIVPREELVRRLWPDGTFVDFERGLNAAVTRLRQALTESAENPRYIETVARRGYRFIGEVRPETAPVPGNPQPEPGAVSVVAPGIRARIRPVLVASAAIVLVAAGWWVLRPRNITTEKPLTVLPLTTDPGNELCASLSLDGTQVVFESDREGGISHLFVKVVGPGDSLRLTHGPAAEYGPAWSRDGRSIAFVRRLDASTVGVFVTPALGVRNAKWLSSLPCSRERGSTTAGWTGRLIRSTWWSAARSALTNPCLCFFST